MSLTDEWTVTGCWIKTIISVYSCCRSPSTAEWRRSRRSEARTCGDAGCRCHYSINVLLSGLLCSCCRSRSTAEWRRSRRSEARTWLPLDCCDTRPIARLLPIPPHGLGWPMVGLGWPMVGLTHGRVGSRVHGGQVSGCCRFLHCCPPVGLTHGVGSSWVEIFQFVLGWVHCSKSTCIACFWVTWWHCFNMYSDQ